MERIADAPLVRCRVCSIQPSEAGRTCMLAMHNPIPRQVRRSFAPRHGRKSFAPRTQAPQVTLSHALSSVPQVFDIGLGLYI